MTNDPLIQQLRLLTQALDPHGIRLIVGGGYGLLLRAEQIRQSGVRTRFGELPGTRSTTDLDIFLSAEVITDADKTMKIRSVLDDLGYKPIDDAKYYQFVLPIKYAGLDRGVKVDLLAAPVTGDRQPQVRQDERRIRPRGGEGLHAHTTPEALTVEDHLVSINISADETPLVVYLPHPFSYLLLKLFALRDRLDDEEKGPYHAFDIYRTIGMMTAEQWEQACLMRDRYIDFEPVPQACKLVRELFESLESAGTIRVRNHARSVGEDTPTENLRALLDDLAELFPLGTS